jgi:hypothetical protein
MGYSIGGFIFILLVSSYFIFEGHAFLFEASEESTISQEITTASAEEHPISKEEQDKALAQEVDKESKLARRSRRNEQKDLEELKQEAIKNHEKQSEQKESKGNEGQVFVHLKEIEEMLEQTHHK